MGHVNTNDLVSAAVPHLVQLADVDENKVTPGLLGFIVFALIGGATWLLMKSLNKQLKRVDFEESTKGQAGALTSNASGGGQGESASPEPRAPGGN